MNSTETVFGRMRVMTSEPALFWGDRWLDYNELFETIDRWREILSTLNIGQGSIVGIFGDYSPGAVGLIYALIEERAVIVPFTPAVETELRSLANIAGVEHMIRFAADDTWEHTFIADAERPALIDIFLEKKAPGLVVFTSGSTGRPKGILQDCERVMQKFVAKREGWRTALFLMLDHFGGFNTLLGAFAYGGAGVCIGKRSPESVCRVIEKSGATLLPTTPTFLNMMLAAGSWKNYDLSSVKLITYGTEVMADEILARIGEIFPSAEIKQTYGLSELGVLRSKTIDGKSTWLKIGGRGFETKVIDGIMWIRSEANMVGYLNAPDPFDEDGWMCTGDRVEVNGDLVRFLGRESDIVNVGGQKVFPAEVENILLKANNVHEASVVGVDHKLLGKMLEAHVSLERPEDSEDLNRRLRKHCLDRLAKFKVPGRFKIVNADDQRNERFKKTRVFDHR